MEPHRTNWVRSRCQLAPGPLRDQVLRRDGRDARAVLRGEPRQAGRRVVLRVLGFHRAHAALGRRGPERRGLRLVISGDTTGEMCGLDEVRGPVDVLIHEATYTDEHEERAKKNTHATARDAGKRAHVMQARLLVLTHFSARLKEVTQSLDEAASEHAPVMAAEDGDILQIGEMDVELFRIAGHTHEVRTDSIRESMPNEGP